MMVVGIAFVLFGYGTVNDSIRVMNLSSYLVGIGLFVGGAIFVAIDAVLAKLEELANRLIEHKSFQSTQPIPKVATEMRPIWRGEPWSEEPRLTSFNSLRSETKGLIEDAKKMGLVIEFTDGRAVIGISATGSSYAYSESSLVSILQFELKQRKAHAAQEVAAEK
jgi:hypothetical protein